MRRHFRTVGDTVAVPLDQAGIVCGIPSPMTAVGNHGAPIRPEERRRPAGLAMEGACHSGRGDGISDANERSRQRNGGDMPSLDIEPVDRRFLPPVGRGALIILFICYAVNLLDRSIISFLAVPLKADLHLSDAEFGTITGPVFSTAYASFSLLFAYFADRYNRAKLLAGFLIVWSGATLACGFVSSFTQLLLARLVVGIGEAGGTPTSYALVSDCVPKERLSSAYATFALATPCGILLAATAGTAVGEYYGWRVAFMACGIVGLLLVLAVRWKIRDFRAVTPAPSGPGRPHPLRALLGGTAVSFRKFKSCRSTVLVLGSYSFSIFLSSGILNWSPIFFHRYHGLPAHSASTYSGLAYCAGLAPGLLLGGLVADRLARRNRMGMLYLPWVVMPLSLPLFILAFQSANWHVALTALALGAFTLQLGTGATWGAFNATILPEVRAFGTAGLLVGSALIGGGLGNLLVGVLSDQLTGSLGASGLRAALLIVVPLFGFIAWSFLVLAGRFYIADLDRRDLGR
jgi:MFS family permease